MYVMEEGAARMHHERLLREAENERLARLAWSGSVKPGTGARRPARCSAVSAT